MKELIFCLILSINCYSQNGKYRNYMERKGDTLLLTINLVYDGEAMDDAHGETKTFKLTKFDKLQTHISYDFPSKFVIAKEQSWDVFSSNPPRQIRGNIEILSILKDKIITKIKLIDSPEKTREGTFTFIDKSAITKRVPH